MTNGPMCLHVRKQPQNGKIPIYRPYPVIVPNTAHLHDVLQRDFVGASGSLLVLPGAAADTRWQYSTLHYAGGSTACYA